MERLDALTVRESNGKSYFTKIGAAFPSKQGNGYTLMLDAVPASVDGQYRILLMVPKPRDGDGSRGAPAQAGRQANADTPSWGEDAPFASNAGIW